MTNNEDLGQNSAIERQTSDAFEGVIPDTLFDHLETQPYATLEPEIHEIGIAEGKRRYASAVMAALSELGIDSAPVMARAESLFGCHTVRLMRVENLAAAGVEIWEHPGIVGHCQQTGRRVTVFSGDRWTGHKQAPMDPVQRLVFGMDIVCAGHKHEALRG